MQSGVYLPQDQYFAESLGAIHIVLILSSFFLFFRTQPAPPDMTKIPPSLVSGDTAVFIEHYNSFLVSKETFQSLACSLDNFLVA